MAEFSLDQAYGRAEPPKQAEGHAFTLEEAYGGKPPAQTNTVLQRLKNVGGDVAVLADMVLSAPAFAISTGAQLTGTVRAMAEGSKTPFEQGRAVGQGVLELPGIRSAVNPLQKIIQDFAGLDPYEGSNVAKGMEKLMGGVEAAGKWVEERTGGRVPRDSVPMFLDTFLTSLTGVAGGKRKPIDPVIAKSMKEAAERMRQTAELELKTQETARAEQAIRRPVQAEINSMLGVKTPQQRAAEVRKRREDVRAAFKQPGEGSDFVDIDESIFKAEERAAQPDPFDLSLEQRVGGTVYEVGSSSRPERIGQAEILRVLQKPGFERTAEDLLTLRRARLEEGKASPEALMLLSAAGIGGAVGAVLDEDDPFMGAVAGTLGGGAAGAAGLRALRGKFRQDIEQGRVLETLVYSKGIENSRIQTLAKELDQLALTRERMLKEKDTAKLQEVTSGIASRRAEFDQLMKMRDPTYGQKGEVSPELLGVLGTAGLGATAGAFLSDDKLRGAMLGGLTGAAAGLPFAGRGEAIRQLRGQTGAVKGPGGNWAPEAVERLSKPLGDNLAKDAVQVLDRAYYSAEGAAPEKVAAAKSLLAQSDRMVRNYLNKYAGTDRDPLKDVEVPFREGTKRWEELTDKVFLKEKRLGPKGEEDTWLFTDRGINSLDYSAVEPRRMLESYLSHVGDYLRQNVPVEKLGQYDLVRAVKETAANDARVAKQMEKAASDSTAQLPIYKQYPDGFRWVELKLPEKLTPEQAKGVRPVTEHRGYISHDGKEIDVKYEAVDASGKPIKNSYTDQIAEGRTPEEAFLAGRLAEEGNQMGHCVGGYCEGVAAGESKIYSLRDAKGRSHVTVEVEPWSKTPKSKEFEVLGLARELQKQAGVKAPTEFGVWLEYVEAAKERLGIKMETGQDISQIKGKQNRAPNAEYLPYVQDFVKSGKWGDVRDLENTGLFPIRQPGGSRYPSSISDRQAQIRPQEAGLEPGYYTEAELQKALHAAEQNPRRGDIQRGAIDPQLTIGLGALGLGGLIGAQLGDDPLEGGILGALAGAALGFTASGRQRLREAAGTLDTIGGPIRTRLQNASPELALGLVDTERKILTKAGDRLLQTVPFSKALERLPEAAQRKFEAAALTGDGAEIAAQAKGNPELVAAIRATRNVLNELGQEAQGRGRFKTLAADYFPRMVKDYEGLMAALGKNVEGPIAAKIAAAEAKSLKERGLPLSEVERSVLVNQELFGSREAKSRLLGSFKARTVPEVTEQLLPYYYPLREGLFRYVVDATDDLETAKFFGRDEVLLKKDGGQTVTNVPLSAGNMVGRLIKEGKLKPDDEKMVVDLLTSRFLKSRKPPNWWVQQLRSGSHLTLLGNPASAAVQLGDPMMAFYNTGMKATLTALGRTLTGNAKITARDFHLSDHIAQEFFDSSSGGLAKGKLAQAGMIGGGAALGGMLADEDVLSGALGGAAAGWVAAVGTANAVNKAFKTVGFTAIDNFGKNVHLNSALSKYQNLAQTGKGIARIAEKYQTAFGDRFPELVRDLKDRRLTENVRLLAFNELSDMQPITKSEMSQMWLENPNIGRLALTLKTFTQKMIDIARRDGYNEIKKGNVAKGLRNLTALGLTLGVSGASADAVRDFILGREVDLTAGDVLENALKTIGFSEYVRDKASTDPVAAIGGAFLPPYQVMDDILSRDPKAAQYIPIIGKLYYSWELGGKEDDELRRAREAKKRGEDFDLSDAARERRREKRAAARRKREEEAEQ